MVAPLAYFPNEQFFLRRILNKVTKYLFLVTTIGGKYIDL